MILPRYWTEADREDYEERAAIIEEGDKVSREVAEDRALRIVEARVRERMRDGQRNQDGSKGLGSAYQGEIRRAGGKVR